MFGLMFYNLISQITPLGLVFFLVTSGLLMIVKIFK